MIDSFLNRETGVVDKIKKTVYHFEMWVHLYCCTFEKKAENGCVSLSKYKRKWEGKDQDKGVSWSLMWFIKYPKLTTTQKTLQKLKHLILHSVFLHMAKSHILNFFFFSLHIPLHFKLLPKRFRFFMDNNNFRDPEVCFSFHFHKQQEMTQPQAPFIFFQWSHFSLVALLMFTMSLTALFTALGAEVMSRSEDAFELDRLSTVILSQEYTVLLTPLKYLKILKKWKKCEDFQQRNLFKSLKCWFHFCTSFFLFLNKVSMRLY